MTDLLEKEIHVGDTVLRARTYKSTGVLWSIYKVVGIMNVMIKVQDGENISNVAPRNCIVIDENDIPENWRDE
jgi:hypothetical protein